jgi:hypothetical protein
VLAGNISFQAIKKGASESPSQKKKEKKNQMHSLEFSTPQVCYSTARLYFLFSIGNQLHMP